MKRITIIGAGNAGCALAAELSLRKYEVTLYADESHSTHFNAIEKKGAITLAGKLFGTAYVHKLTHSVKAAIIDADIVFLSVPSYGQIDLFNKMLPYLSEGQVFISLSGNFSSLCFLNILKKKNINKNIVVGDLNSSVHACRVLPQAEVYIFSNKNKLILSLSNHSLLLTRQIGALLDRTITLGSNLLEANFNNTNSIIHPAPMLLNIGWIETTKGDFYFYKEGISTSIATLLEKEDEEKILIGRQYSMNLLTFLQTIEEFYDQRYDSILSFVRYSQVHNTIKGTPHTLKNRYIMEDVPYALVPWSFLAKKAGVDAPVTNLLIQLASNVYDIDFMEVGRTLEQMGLEGMSYKEILEYIHPEGYSQNSISSELKQV